MTRGVPGALAPGSACDHEATVVETVRLAPRLLRVWMTAPGLLTGADVGPASWVRFWFPGPAGSIAEFQRAYTLAEWDTASGVFAVDFVLHDRPGPATAWARAAGPGSTVLAGAFGPRHFVLPPGRAGYLLVGDAAALPAINGVLGTAPPEVPVEVVLEQHAPDDPAMPVTAHPRAHVRWVPRRDAASLAAALEPRDRTGWTAWAAGELGSVLHVGHRLREEFGLPPGEVHVRHYWTRGQAAAPTRRVGDA